MTNEGPPEFARAFTPLLLGFGAIGHPPAALWGAFAAAMERRGHTSFEDLLARGQATVSDVWKEALSPLPTFAALRAGAAVPVGAYAVVDYLAACCENVEEGLRRLTRYFTLVRPGVRIELRVEADRARVDYQDERRDDPFFDQWTTGVIVQRFRGATGLRFALLEARFRAAEGSAADAAEARELLGCSPTVGAEVGGFTIGLDVWRAPLLLRDERMRQSLEAHAESLLAEHGEGPDATQRRVREAIAGELRGGDPSIQTVAKKLATTPRTLQRRLAEQGVSYQQVVDGLRAELAERYLERERLAITEVAFLLGYSEASSFARAYRRWKGRSPVESRRERRDAQ